MSQEVWDGKPRRKNDAVMMAMEAKVDSIYAFLQREFGNTKDDGFGITEGDTKRALRENKDSINLLTAQMKIQNGRLFEIEKWKILSEQEKTDKKNDASRNNNLFMTISTIIMAISALVIMFKK